MRFQDAKPDGRAIVYAHIQADPLVARVADLLAVATTVQRVLGRAVMNGESTDPLVWRAMFPTLFGQRAAAAGTPERERSEAILAASLQVADRGEQTRSQFRGAVVEALSERGLNVLLQRRVPCNDGGVSLGQAVVASRCRAEGIDRPRALELP